ncbi:MAG: phosphate ABC transporter permease subunit PstC [Bacillota bacterium]|nr:phosphate ABC transporter permease subunit PstC [Bacillota bacterium]
MKAKTLNNIKNEYLGRSFAVFCGVLIVCLTISILVFLSYKGIKLFTADKYPLYKFLFSSNWKPDADTPGFGALIFILGSVFVSSGAILIAAPVSVALAVFINFISPKLGKKVILPSLELFVGIPSVVYGWIGISVLVPILKNLYGGIGFSLLAGIIVLSIMILPTVASISSDALKSVPRDYLEASYGLGATRWQTIKNVIVPASSSGILTGIVLGLARAFGEALAVQMVIGNTLKMPFNLLKPTTTLTSILTMDMANTIEGTPYNDALWSLAFLLLIISFIFILIVRKIGKRGEINE